MMYEKLHYSLNLIFATVSIVMAICFLALPSPNTKELRNYRISKRVLAIAYFVISLLTILLLSFDIRNASRELLAFSTVFISATQAILFTFTLLTLLNPYLLSLRNILWRVLLLLLILLLYVVSNMFFGDPVLLTLTDLHVNIFHPTVLLRICFVAYYVGQLFLYTRLFLHEERKFANELNNYFSETVQLRLSWVRYAFLSALIIAILSLLSNFLLSLLFDTFLTSFFILFYFVFAIAYLRYTNIFNIIEPAIKVAEQSVVMNTDNFTRWEILKTRILNEKIYLNPNFSKFR